MYKILNDYLIQEIDNKILKKKYDINVPEFNLNETRYLWAVYLLENP